MARRPTDDRRLSAIGLARLLTRLDPDAQRAPAEYERLRRTLIRFFDLRGAWAPEECADESLDRLARRLETEGGDEQEIEDVRRYAHGIARLVLLERLRAPAPVSISDVDLENLPAPAPVPSVDGNPRQECFDCCLSVQPEESRSLALRYYVAEGQAKIDNRRGLARALGITENALRRRVQRIRERLEQCMTGCTAEAAARGIDAATRRVLTPQNPLQVDSPDDA